MIELRNVSKTYLTGKTKIDALKGVNFAVNRGDFVVIRGPSGSGKSTLLNILGLLDEPTSGEVYLNEKRISFHDFDALATVRSQSIAFIFQSFNLNPVLTCYENVMVPLMIRREISKKEKERRVAEWIEKVGLQNHSHHRPDELSGGQRQRVAIARAMVMSPGLLIADEPTANLDSVMTKQILDLMAELNLSQKVSFVFATHDPIMDSYAKKIIAIKDGVLG